MRYRLLCLWILASCLLYAADSQKVWEILTDGAAESSPYKRSPAISALGTIPTPAARKLVDAALVDKEILVRLAAVSAIAERKSRADIPRLKIALDDDSGEVSFIAARALWEMSDHAGRELLEELLAGERKPSTGFIKQQIQGAKATMHNRKELIWLGAKEGAGFLFGPLGTGLGVMQMVMKDGAAPERALSATMLGEIKDAESIAYLGDALFDKSPLVRAAAAKALGGINDPTVPPKLEKVLDDKVDAVRYMVAASLLRTDKSKLKEKAPKVKVKS
jgi:HEAT repeat protein